MAHLPVMVAEVVACLVTDPHGRYGDFCVGEGGHARALLAATSADARLLCADRDPEAVAVAAEALRAYGERVRVIHARFGEVAGRLQAEGWSPLSGVLLDLGLRSTALDDPARGFSYRQDSPLDMRFDRTVGESAAELLARIRPDALVRILEAGTTRASPRAVARALLESRRDRGVQTTGDLVRCLRAALGRKATKKLVASVFATLRMAVNEELEELERALATLPAMLETGGVLCVISYQSQEDSRAKALGKKDLRDPIRGEAFHMEPRYAKPLRPTRAEVQANPRARSACLRAFMRVPGTRRS